MENQVFLDHFAESSPTLFHPLSLSLFLTERQPPRERLLCDAMQLLLHFTDHCV